MAPALNFVLPGAASATLVTSDGNHVSLLSSIPSPPGSTLKAEVARESHPESNGQPYLVKVRGCHKEPDGRFLITGRFVSLARAQRALVLERSAAVATGAAAPDASAPNDAAPNDAAPSVEEPH